MAQTGTPLSHEGACAGPILPGLLFPAMRVLCCVLLALPVATKAQPSDASARWRANADVALMAVSNGAPRTVGPSVAVRMGRGAVEGGVGYVAVHEVCALCKTSDDLTGIGLFAAVREGGSDAHLSGGIGLMRYEEARGGTAAVGFAPMVRVVMALQAPGGLGAHGQALAVVTRRSTYPMVGLGLTF